MPCVGGFDEVRRRDSTAPTVTCSRSKARPSSASPRTNRFPAKGQRIHTGKSEAANRLFASQFTDHYAELAALRSGVRRPAEHLRPVPGGGPAGSTIAFRTALVGTWVSFAAQRATSPPPSSRPRRSNRSSTTGSTTAKTSWCRWPAESTAACGTSWKTTRCSQPVSHADCREVPVASPLSCRKAAGGGTRRANERRRTAPT